MNQSIPILLLSIFIFWQMIHQTNLPMDYRMLSKTTMQKKVYRLQEDIYLENELIK
jgi:hypothetical protein